MEAPQPSPELPFFRPTQFSESVHPVLRPQEDFKDGGGGSLNHFPCSSASIRGRKGTSPAPAVPTGGGDSRRPGAGRIDDGAQDRDWLGVKSGIPPVLRLSWSRRHFLAVRLRSAPCCREFAEETASCRPAGRLSPGGPRAAASPHFPGYAGPGGEGSRGHPDLTRPSAAPVPRVKMLQNVTPHKYVSASRGGEGALRGGSGA
jgi:hypothetical protein